MPKREEARRLRSLGEPLQSIAIKLGIPRSSTFYMCRGIKLSAEQEAENKKSASIKRLASRPPKVSDGTKFCPGCKRTKPGDQFHKRGPYLMGYCKPCQRKHSCRDKAKLRAKLKAIIQKAKEQPCTDCGESHPYWAMDFDHLDPKKKAFEIGKAHSRGTSVKKLQEELSKCELVCALCHRYRTNGMRRGRKDGT